jgi:hypothetical protein
MIPEPKYYVRKAYKQSRGKVITILNFALDEGEGNCQFHALTTLSLEKKSTVPIG